jgi:thiamine biosynthesis lipoprotein
MSAVRRAGGRASGSTRIDFGIWSTTATLIVTNPVALQPALLELSDELASVDAACSRFRADSEISRILAHPGQPVTLSPVLNEAVGHAIRVARATDGLVDPTVAAAVVSLGYDGDIGDVVGRVPASALPVGRHQSAPGAHLLVHDPKARQLFVPPGVGLDLGATAKALAADRAAARIAELIDGGVLIGLGGDIAIAGEAPEGGWRIAITDDHRTGSPVHQTVSIRSGAIATSSTTARRWRTSSGWAHHIIDPRTGANPESTWRTVSVAAGCCVDANAAATAAIVLGSAAPDWLALQQLPALLIDLDGDMVAVNGWPTAEPLAVPA